MWSCLHNLVGQCPLSKLHGVSVIVTKLCFYSAHQTQNGLTIEPQKIPADPQLMTDQAFCKRVSGCALVSFVLSAKHSSYSHIYYIMCNMLYFRHYIIWCNHKRRMKGYR
jgi:hypothetical protein